MRPFDLEPELGLIDADSIFVIQMSLWPSQLSEK